MWSAASCQYYIQATYTKPFCLTLSFIILTLEVTLWLCVTDHNSWHRETSDSVVVKTWKWPWLQKEGGCSHDSSILQANDSLLNFQKMPDVDKSFIDIPLEDTDCVESCKISQNFPTKWALCPLCCRPRTSQILVLGVLPQSGELPRQAESHLRFSETVCQFICAGVGDSLAKLFIITYHGTQLLMFVSLKSSLYEM